MLYLLQADIRTGRLSQAQSSVNILSPVAISLEENSKFREVDWNSFLMSLEPLISLAGRMIWDSQKGIDLPT